MPIPIITIIVDGGTLTVQRNGSGSGYCAKIDLPRWSMSANGDTPEAAISGLAELLASGVAL